MFPANVLVCGSGYLSSALNHEYNYHASAGRSLSKVPAEVRTLIVLNSHLNHNINEDYVNSFVERCKKMLISGRLKRLVFISSVALYGYSKKNISSERSPVLVDTPYQLEKFSMEKMIASFCEDNNIRYHLLRVSNLFGSVGLNIEPNRGFFYFLKKAAMKNEVIKVDHGGRQFINFIHVYDVCDAVRRCVEECIPSGVYNVGSTQSVQLLEITKFARKIFSDLSFQFTDDGISEINSFISSQKYYDVTGVNYQVNYEYEIREWMKK